MEREYNKMTDEEFEQINTNDKLLHSVVYAHGTSKYDDLFIAFGEYPKEYLVTKKQIAKARQIFDDKKIILKQKYRTNNTLVFVGMGMSFKSKNKLYINNHRIRAQFKNKDNKLCFIEVGTTTDKNFMRCDHSIYDYNKHKQNENNYNNLERSPKQKYTYNNLLNLINKNFECNFSQIVIDNYTFSSDEFTSISPKK